MDEKEKNFQALASFLNDKLASTKLYYDFFQDAQKIACQSPNASLININDFILEKIKNSNASSKIVNTIYDFEEESNNSPNVNSYLSKAQATWEKKLIKGLNAMSAEFNLPLSKKRSTSESQELRRLWNELGTTLSDLKKFRPIFSINEFLDFNLTVKCSNLTDIASKSITGMLNVPIKIKTLSEIKLQYKNSSLEYFQSGLDENLNSIIEVERLKTGQKVVEINDLILSREFSKQGCTKSLRGKLWAQMLNVTLEPYDVVYHNYLKQCVLDYDLLIDTIYYKDVKSTPVNDDQVFVFEDLLYQVLLLFSRDSHVLKCFEPYCVQPPKSITKNKSPNDQKLSAYPPNGFIPFHGFSMLVAPICFAYSDPVMLYYIFRKFFMTHFHKLNIITSDSQSILGLCLLFETLLQAKDPQLFFHLRKIDAQPLKIVFKWIMRAFSGYLASCQLLELWDRILAYNSLEILPVFAVGVFLYRKQSLMTVVNRSNVESILEDLGSLKVVAILQLVLL